MKLAFRGSAPANARGVPAFDAEPLVHIEVQEDPRRRRNAGEQKSDAPVQYGGFGACSEAPKFTTGKAAELSTGAVVESNSPVRWSSGNEEWMRTISGWLHLLVL